MGDDLIERLIAEADARDANPDEHDASLTADMRKAAADLARLRAENEALRTERDELDALYHEGGTWEQQLSEAEAARAAAEAKAARLETALRRAIALAEVMLTNDPNETISDAGHTLLEWWMAELENLRAALEAKP